MILSMSEELLVDVSSGRSINISRDYEQQEPRRSVVV